MITPQVCEQALARLQNASKTQLQEARNFFSKRDLESHLAALIDAARGHESNNVPPGTPQYLVLHNQAERLITAYCDRWKTTIDQLKAELPALERLRTLAQPPLRKAPMIHIALAFLASIAAAFALGIAAACVRLGYHLAGGGR